MAHASPIIRDGILIYPRDESPVQIPVDSSDWYAWLQTATVFSLHSDDGDFTVRKEMAGNRRGGSYWRVYRKHEGKLRRAYAGKSEGLTLERLCAIAAGLVHQDMGGTPRAEQKRPTGTSVSPRPSSPKAHRPHLESASAGRVSSRATTLHLPVPLTALIGREHELAEACRLLRRPDVRLLTLAGTGGVGKTRLALQVAIELQREFADGACFVPLAPVSDPARVMATIAQTVGLWEIAALSSEDQVHAALRDRHLLLVLDNFEHLVQGAPQLTALLASCAHLRLIVTSRVALHLSGEHEFPVAPLAVPDLTELPPPETFTQQAAVHLFVRRAQAIQPAFDVTPANARAIAEICVRLDGLPLAIELAAARSKLLPPQALLNRLSHRLEILTGEHRTCPPVSRRCATPVSGATTS